MLGETFAKVLGGAALLPTIRPLGDVDADEFLFDAEADDLTLPPAIAPIRAGCCSPIGEALGRDARRRAGLRADHALARGLAHFLDECQTQGADLSKLDELAPASLAEHWKKSAVSSKLLRTQWPLGPGGRKRHRSRDHRNRALSALARRLAKHPPAGPVIAAARPAAFRRPANCWA